MITFTVFPRLRQNPNEKNNPYIENFIELWKITCEDVTAKAEITPKTPEGVAYAPAKGDGMPLDESHILDMQKERK